MSDLFDLEAEMTGTSPPGWEAKVQRARERVAAFNALPIAEQYTRITAPCDGICQIPEMRRIATRFRSDT